MKGISKKLFKKTSVCLTLIASLSFKSLMAVSSKNSENFNFIKSQENNNDFLYDGSLLLYGGIALVALSVLGTIFTFLPPRNRKKKNKINLKLKWFKYMVWRWI